MARFYSLPGSNGGNGRSRRQERGEWGGKYSNEGTAEFYLEGTVNSINEDQANAVDYVEFFIQNPVAKNNICLFSVTVDWDLPQLSEGEKVVISGVMRTWKSEGNGPRIELVATGIQKVNNKKEGR